MGDLRGAPSPPWEGLEGQDQHEAAISPASPSHLSLTKWPRDLWIPSTNRAMSEGAIQGPSSKMHKTHTSAIMPVPFPLAEASLPLAVLSDTLLLVLQLFRARL